MIFSDSGGSPAFGTWPARETEDRARDCSRESAERRELKGGRVTVSLWNHCCIYPPPSNSTVYHLLENYPLHSPLILLQYPISTVTSILTVSCPSSPVSHWLSMIWLPYTHPYRNPSFYRIPVHLDSPLISLQYPISTVYPTLPVHLLKCRHLHSSVEVRVECFEVSGTKEEWNWVEGSEEGRCLQSMRYWWHPAVFGCHDFISWSLPALYWFLRSTFFLFLSYQYFSCFTSTITFNIHIISNSAIIITPQKS